MGVTRAENVKKRKKKEIEKTLNWIVYPPVIVGALLFGTGKKKRRKRR